MWRPFKKDDLFDFNNLFTLLSTSPWPLHVHSVSRFFTSHYTELPLRANVDLMNNRKSPFYSGVFEEKNYTIVLSELEFTTKELERKLDLLQSVYNLTWLAKELNPKLTWKELRALLKDYNLPVKKTRLPKPNVYKYLLKRC